MMSPRTWTMVSVFLLYLTSQSLSEFAVCLSKDPGYHLPFMPRSKILELLREHFAPTNDQIRKPQVIDLVPLAPGESALFLPFTVQPVQQWHTVPRGSISFATPPWYVSSPKKKKITLALVILTCVCFSFALFPFYAALSSVPCSPPSSW